MSKKFKRNLKIIFSVFLALAFALLLIIFIQTIKINKKTSEVNSLKQQNEASIELLQKQEEEIAYFESDGYKEDYEKFQLESGENNVIYKWKRTADAVLFLWGINCNLLFSCWILSHKIF